MTSLHEGCGCAGNLLGLAISPLILSRFGWRGLFCIFGILGGPLLAFWQAVVPARSPKGLSQQSPGCHGQLVLPKVYVPALEW